MPAQAGIQLDMRAKHTTSFCMLGMVYLDWIPACAGMTSKAWRSSIQFTH
jgi:hypothetical protein